MEWVDSHCDMPASEVDIMHNGLLIISCNTTRTWHEFNQWITEIVLHWVQWMLYCSNIKTDSCLSSATRSVVPVHNGTWRHWLASLKWWRALHAWVQSYIWTEWQRVIVNRFSQMLLSRTVACWTHRPHPPLAHSTSTQASHNDGHNSIHCRLTHRQWQPLASN